jgi:threonine/homoserine efflux transporter RhtA
MLGVLAFGGVVLWVGYVVTAQRVGLFRIESGWPEEAQAAEPRQPT